MSTDHKDGGVFISTTPDLEHLRLLAAEESRAVGFEPIQSRRKDRDALWTQEQTDAELRESSFYIGLFGACYGEIADPAYGGAKSQAEWEFDRATGRNLEQGWTTFPVLVLVPDATSDAWIDIEHRCRAVRRAHFRNDHTLIDEDDRRQQMFLARVLVGDLLSEPTLRSTRWLAARYQRMVVLFRSIEEVGDRLFIEFQNRTMHRGSLATTQALALVTRRNEGRFMEATFENEGWTSDHSATTSPPQAPEGSLIARDGVVALTRKCLATADTRVRPGLCASFCDFDDTTVATVIDAVVAMNPWDADHDPHVVNLRQGDVSDDMLWRALWRAAGVLSPRADEVSDVAALADAMLKAGRPSILVTLGTEAIVGGLEGFKQRFWHPLLQALLARAEHDRTRDPLPTVFVLMGRVAAESLDHSPLHETCDSFNIVEWDLRWTHS